MKSNIRFILKICLIVLMVLFVGGPLSKGFVKLYLGAAYNFIGASIISELLIIIILIIVFGMLILNEIKK